MVIYSWFIQCIRSLLSNTKSIILTGLLLTALLLPACAGPPPKAGFTASATTGPAPLNVTFSDTSQNADRLQWDFGDGSSSTSDTAGDNVTHQYTKAGSYLVVLTAVKEGKQEETSTANTTITVSPGALDKVDLTATIQMTAGDTKQLEITTTDEYDNLVTDVNIAWSVADDEAVAITQGGLLTAGEFAGTFDDAVWVEVTQGDISRTMAASVIIIPGQLEQVVIAPGSVKIGMEMTQQFIAVAADRYGNRISGLDFTWSVENGGGTINSSGFFTAGTDPDTYNDTVKVEATHEGITQSTTADVTIEPDRIAFLSDQDNDEGEFDLYIIDIDGEQQERLTTSIIGIGYYSFSPDGRRITYWVEGDIYTTNDDGKWNIILLSGRHAYEPAWSPDGSKIAFQSWEHDPDRSDGNSEIYVMDVDGGNLIRLTDNSAYEDYPTWSPDGTQIAFVSDRDGNHEIYVMNADGSSQRRLTRNSEMDTFPTWSPDGTKILFQSDRDYRCLYTMDTDGSNVTRLTPTDYSSNCPSWSPDGARITFHEWSDPDQPEICIMEKDGSNIVQLTDNSAIDYMPKWAPRKKGIDVTEESIVIPDTSTTNPMTTEQVTALAQEAVVRIETDSGSGSGFIIDPDGLLLTNNHVVSDAEEITVYLEDGTSYKGVIKARDLVRDLALVRIGATGLTYLEIGNLSTMKLGQQVIVLGYPLGSENIAVTSGLVSATEYDGGRNITWVQTDSAINPGNSGGPMLNLQGQVIGVVSVKLVGVAVEGVGFAISANTVNMYLPLLRDGETIFTFSAFSAVSG
ncbi:MAG: PD40 domain-containing protein [Dehalococcoidales bacterium]|nr:MAG: PD40 domain-containing protein [Dehalococcoidales bacterium]